MPSGDLIAIRMELLGAKEVVAESEAAAGGISSVGRASKATAATSMTAGQKLKRGMGSAFAKVRTAAKFAAAGLAAFAAVVITKAVTATEEFGRTVVGFNRNLGLSVEQSSRWAGVLKAREIDSKSAGMAFKTLSTQLVTAAREGGTAMVPFNQLGISLQDVQRGAKDFGWFLDTRLANALGNAEGGAKRFSAASKLLGRGYQTLLPVFSQGAKGLKEQLHWADEYGVTLHGNSLKSLQDFTTAQRESRVAMLGMQLTIGRTVIPALTALIGFVDKLVIQWRRGTGTGGDLRQVAEGLGQVLKATVPIVVMVAKVLRALVPVIKVLIGVTTWFVKNWKLALFFLSLGGSVAIPFIIEKLWKFKGTVAAVTGAVVGAFKGVLGIFQSVLGGVEKMVGAVGNLLGGPFTKAWKGAVGAVKSAAQAIISAITSLPSRVASLSVDIGSKILEGIKAGLTGGTVQIESHITRNAPGALAHAGNFGKAPSPGPVHRFAPAGGGVIELHNHTHLDGREIAHTVERVALNRRR